MTVSTATEQAIVDTNILVYAHDESDVARHTVANALLRRLALSHTLVFSAQTLNEFYNATTRRGRGLRLSHDEARTILADVAVGAVVVPVTEQMTFRALDTVAQHSLSF